MKTTVFVSGIRIYAFHGVLPQERAVGGDYVVDVRVDYPFQQAMDTDEVDHTLDYSRIYDLVREEMAVPSRLLEHVAGRMARRALADFPLAGGVWVRVTKANPPMGAACQGAGVEVELRK